MNRFLAPRCYSLGNLWFLDPDPSTISCTLVLLHPLCPLQTKETKMATNVDVIVSQIVLTINAGMTSEEAIKEIHTKTAFSVHPSKLIMQVMIVITMTYETVCSTTRAAAAAAGQAYVPHTLPNTRS